MGKLLYGDLTYRIRGACFKIWKELGSAYKESAYQKALGIEFQNLGLSFEPEKSLTIRYDGKEVGRYKPDFIVEDKVLVEVKVVPFLTNAHRTQFWRYLKGSTYKIGFLVNFGGKSLQIIRRIYDTARSA